MKRGTTIGIILLAFVVCALAPSPTEARSQLPLMKANSVNFSDQLNFGQLPPLSSIYTPNITEPHGDQYNITFMAPSPRLLTRIPEPPTGEYTLLDDACSTSDIANYTPTQIVDYVTSHSMDCLYFFWTYDANTLSVFTDAHIQAALNATEDRVATYDGTNNQSIQQLIFYIRTAYYHGSYHSSPNFTNATLLRTIDVYREFANTTYFNNASSDAELTLYHWINGADAAGVSYALVPQLNTIMRTFMNETNRWSRLTQLFNVYSIESYSIPRGLYIGHLNRTQMISSMQQQNVSGILEDIALNDTMIPTAGTSLINNAITSLGYMITVSEFNASSVNTLTKVINHYEPLTLPYLWAVYMLDYYNNCHTANENVSICLSNLTAPIFSVALPNNYSFDNGTRVFITALNYSDVQSLYHAIKQVEWEFGRVAGTVPAVGDNNSVLTMYIYGSPTDYALYQPFLFGLGTNNGGIYIEQWGSFFSYQRTTSESVYTLEELLRHEYTHYLIGRYIVQGNWGEVPIYDNQRMTWFDEGMAEFFTGSTQRDSVKTRKTLVQLIASDSTRLTVSDVFNSSSYNSFTFYRYAALFFNHLYTNDLQQMFDFIDTVKSANTTRFDAYVLSLRTNATYESNYQLFLNNTVGNVSSLLNPSTDFPRYLNTTSLAAIQAAFRQTTFGSGANCSALYSSSANARFNCTGQLTDSVTNASNSVAAWRIFDAALNKIINETLNNTVNVTYTNFRGMNCNMNNITFVTVSSSIYPKTNYSCEGPLAFNTELAQCFDEIDNDGDGFIDYGNDTDCSSNYDTNESHAPPEYPSISIVYPVSSIYVSIVSVFNYTVEDNNIQSCWYSIDQGVTNTTITCGTNVTGLTSSAGTNNWQVYVNDSDGNTNSSTVSFTYIPNALTIGTCTTLNQTNTTYVLNASINPTEDSPCINITAQNVTFTCGRYTIYNVTHANTIIYSNQFNTTIINCKNLTGGSGLASTGIKLVSANYSSIINVSILYARFGFNVGTTNVVSIINSSASAGVDSGVTGTPSNSTFRGNTLSYYSRGYSITGTNNTYSNNTVYGNVQGFESGGTASRYYNNTLLSNTNGFRITVGDIIVEDSYFYNNTYGFLLTTDMDMNLSRTVINASRSDGIAAQSLTTTARINLVNVSFINTTGYDLNISGAYNNSIFNDTSINRYIFSSSGGIYSFSKSGAGNIKFLQSINGSGSNLSSNLNISFNLISVNVTSNPGLNRSANITFYNMLGTFVNPRILKDGSNCTSCYNFTSLNAATVTFNVSNFGNNFTIRGENIGPVVNITYPANTSYSSGPTELNYTLNDTDLQSCWYSIDQGVTNTTITCGTNVTGLTSSAGTNNWQVYVNDSLGNTNSSNVTFFVTTSGASGSGGGGSGSSSSGSGTTYTYEIPDSVLAEGYTTYVSVGSVLKFTLKNDNHSIRVISFTDTDATILIQSDPTVVVINRGESKQVDLDKDGKGDIMLKYESVSNGKLSLTVQKVQEAIEKVIDHASPPIDIATKGCVEPSCPSSAKGLIIVALIACLTGISFFIAWYSRFRSKRRVLMGFEK